jgi:hypothetical protein
MGYTKLGMLGMVHEGWKMIAGNLYMPTGRKPTEGKGEQMT